MEKLTSIKIFLKKLVPGASIFIVIWLLLCCESKERYYRPDLPEKLCCIGIIDADDTSDYHVSPEPFAPDDEPIIRFISFEKSYQSEYSQEINDSLREFSFSISLSDKELFNYHSDSTIKELGGFEIPANIEFHSGEEYYLFAGEKTTSPISAVTKVPEHPSKPSLISINHEITTTKPSDCLENAIYKLANIKFSFENDPEQNLYYAIHIEGIRVINSDYIIREAKEFDVKECNATGFFAELSGYTRDQMTCIDNKPVSIKVPLLAYFIEGSKIPDNRCIIKFSTIFIDDFFIWKWRRKLKVKVLSIPRELFLFEKSLYTYGKNSSDPFSEPVYLNGNIKGGNGVFAICRSAELIINLSPPY